MPARFIGLTLFLLTEGIACLTTVPLPAQPTAPTAPRTANLLFCFWNVENFFDDQPNPKLDPKLDKVDREFDTYFARDPDALGFKLERLSEVLLGPEMKAGQGPDILALAEVESLRAVELLRDELNRKLGPNRKQLHYPYAFFKDPGGLRSIGTGVISRFPAEGTPRILGNMQRILEVKIQKDGQILTVIASHWTSRVSDKTGKGRSNYARRIYDEFKNQYRANPNVDFLVCGDFNDTPFDDAVIHDLHATGNLQAILSLDKKQPPQFFNPSALLAEKKMATHFQSGRENTTPLVFDQICLSPGLLDGTGWSYVNNSAVIVKKFEFRGRPDRFGGPNDGRPWRNRGASDHFPVTIQLRVTK